LQVIGTAGHVDHGKSTLINRLTGINPDRLKAEQDREMSIELGFAWLKLPNGQDVGIVDVPGHRDFIENMLAGIGGIDAVLFVVAADEGVMPQTMEHLAIIDLLQIPTGVVALTKIDLIDDPEWLDLVEADLSDILSGTVLADAPIVRVSARSGTGLESLVEVLQGVLSEQPHRPDLNRPRLPVDRVFTLPGFGTIVTGTLSNGHLTVGDLVEILPSGVEGRIRGLQTHKQSEENAFPGSRTAVNISGVSVNQIERGNVVVHPGTYQPSKMVDVWCTLLPNVDAPLKHNSEVKLFLGAAEVMSRVRLLGVDELKPGCDAFVQLMLQEPVVALRQDRFIIRRPSPPKTIAGGQIIDPHPLHRHKRFNTKRLDELEQLLIGTPEDILLQTLHKLGSGTLNQIIQASGLEAETAEHAARVLQEQQIIVDLNGKGLLITQDWVNKCEEKIQQTLVNFHHDYPLRLGMPREQLKSQTGYATNVFNAYISQMTKDGTLEDSGSEIHLKGYRVSFSEAQQIRVNNLLNQFEAQPYAPPTVKQSLTVVGEPLMTALIETGQLVQLGEDVLFLPAIFQEMKAAVVTHIQEHGSITLAELRDKFDTSRKYVVAVLEHLDQTGVTARRGDIRILRRS